jgi:hypothetical protein
MNLIKFIENVKQNGGASHNINTGEFNPQNGYFASIQGREKIVDKINKVILLQFIKDNIDLLTDHDNFLGAWTNDGKIYLDVSKKFKDKQFALLFGEVNQQLAIYDANKGEVINL